MGKTLIKIGPADPGRRTSLTDFEDARAPEGYLYEQSRGVITASDVPHRLHMLLVAAIRRIIFEYEVSHPGRIRCVLGTMECKLLIPAFDSERHQDLAIYFTGPPPIDDSTLWRHWLPEVVIEVVSPGSRKRDYEEKPEEYLRLGVKEYGIVDARKQAMVVMRRTRGRWVERRIRPPALYRTRRLPGLEFSCGAVFAAAGLN
jgi:Uma2 family endonuclease